MYSEVMKRKKKRRKVVAFTLDPEIKGDFMKYCRQRGMTASRRIDILLKKDMDEFKKKKNHW